MEQTDRTDRHHRQGRASLLSLCLLLGGILLLCSGCDTGVTDPEDIVFPDSDVSYRSHVQPLLELGCSFGGCHNSIDKAGNLSLENYIDLFNRPGLVLPGDSARSLLVQVTSGRQPHVVTVSELITTEQARGLALWVEEGASNN